MRETHIGGIILVAALLAGGVPSAKAQETGDIVGQVIGAGHGEPIASAQVEVIDTGHRMPADAAGRFHLARQMPGEVALRLSAVGYRPADTTVIVKPGETFHLTVRLDVAPIQVSGIEVSVLRPDLRRLSQLEQEAVREANPTDPGELLRQVSGVDAARRGPLGLDPNVRGLVETEVASFVDGERRFPAGPARMDSPLTHVDALAFRALQVVKGPYALTWGSGSLSAVRAETERLPPEREGAAHGNLTAGYDTNVNGVETAAGLSGRRGALSYWGFGAYRDGQDYEDGDGNLIEGDYTSREARGKLGLELGSSSRIVVSGGYQDQGPVDYPGRILNADFFDTWNASAEYSLIGYGGSLGSLTARVYYNDTDHGMTNGGKPSAVMNDIRVATSTRVVGGRVAGIFALGGWELEAGGDVYSANRNAVREIRMAQTGMLMLRDLVWPDATTTAGGVFVRGDRAFAGLFDMSATVRLDVAGSMADTASDWFLANVGSDLSSSSTNLSGAVTLGLHVTSNWMLYSSVGSAVRAPDATELYSDRFPASKGQMSAEFVGNPELRPERSTQLDVGFDGSYSILTLQGNVFARNITDYVTLELTDLEKKLPISPDDVYRYINGDAVFWGLEASAGIRVASPWTLKLRTDYLWGKDRELDEPAFGVMPWRGSVGIRFDPPGRRFSGEATVTVAGDQSRVASSRGEAPTDGWVTGDVRFAWQVTGPVLVRFGVQNVAHEFYVNHLNAKNPFTGERIAEPGRIFYLSFGLSF